MVPITYNIRSLFVRKTTTIATVLGIALVVFVLATSLMLAAGIKRTMKRSGQPNQVLVLSKGAETELGSFIDIPLVKLLSSLPQVKKAASGEPLIGAENVVMIIFQNLGDDGLLSNVQVRGVPENVFTLRPELQMIQGRRPRPGSDEVIIGKAIRGRFKDVEFGKRFDLKENRPVTVVGVFAANGSAFESEIWCDNQLMVTSFDRKWNVSSLTAALENPGAFDGLRMALENDKRLKSVQAVRVIDYYEKQSEGTSSFIKMLGWVTALLFSFGAVIGATITMYAAVWQRRREIGTLQALGFSGVAILTSFLLEAMIVAFVGGIIGAAASLVMTQVKLSILNFATWQEVTFSFAAEPSILLTALLFGGAMGVIGGIFPAVRAARMAPLDAMREG